MKFLKKVAIAFAAILLCTSCKFLPDLAENPWQTIPVATQSNLLDIAFTEDAAHGWIVGSSATLLETTDAGETWETKSLALDTDQKARFTSISFRDSEGWIAGEPGILLHSTDAGESWNRIVLSNKLPGEPFVITALDSNSAEMMTDVGAIYQTQDGGQSWKAMVEEAVGVVRNVARSEDGRYITVSAKGNFYSTWAPGDRAWTPRNRYSSKKLENMGFGEDGRLWMLARGGELRFSDVDAEEGWGEPINPEYATSWGLLDLAYRSPEEIWVAGGSGNLLCSFDGGETWQKDRAVTDVPSNFNRIKFFTPDDGFILGQRGTLLKYEGRSEPSA